MLEDDRWPDFLAAFGKRRGEEKFKAMLDWRKANNIDRIMDKSHSKFFVFKVRFFSVLWRADSLFFLLLFCPCSLVSSDIFIFSLSLISVLFSFSRATRFLCMVARRRASW